MNFLLILNNLKSCFKTVIFYAKFFGLHIVRGSSLSDASRWHSSRHSSANLLFRNGNDSMSLSQAWKSRSCNWKPCTHSWSSSLNRNFQHRCSNTSACTRGSNWRCSECLLSGNVSLTLLRRNNWLWFWNFILIWWYVKVILSGSFFTWRCFHHFFIVSIRSNVPWKTLRLRGLLLICHISFIFLFLFQIKI